jgi:hypothetical protein
MKMMIISRDIIEKQYHIKKTHVKFVLDELKKNKILTIEILLSILKDKFKEL